MTEGEPQAPRPDDGLTLASWVELEGCFNFRDLGGYRTADGRALRTGRVFRSDGLHHLSERDVEHLCGSIGLGRVIDLRSEDEVDEDGFGRIESRVTIHSVPLFSKVRSRDQAEDVVRAVPDDMGELYYMMLTAAREPIAEVLRIIAGSDVPVVFHCSAGKDRTGVISALILSALGVPDETLVADYAFSRQNIDRINARLSGSATYQRFMEQLPEGAYDADPAAMRRFLGRVRAQHGTVRAWCEEAGIGPDVLAGIEARLLR